MEDLAIRHRNRLRQVLDLAGTQVTGAGLMQLKGLTKLNNLHLPSKHVTDAERVHLKGFRT